MPIPISGVRWDYQERRCKTMRRSLLQACSSVSRSKSMSSGQGDLQSPNNPEEREEIGLSNSLTHCSEKCN
jgi:hypothetical protein